MMERGIINSGPLVALSLLGRLDLLPLLFREFWIPEAVYREVAVAGLGKPGAASLSDPQWLAYVRAASAPDPLLVSELDTGEAAVISLARASAPCIAIIDERRGRKIATDVYGIAVKGTAGLLVEANRHDLLADLRGSLVGLKRSGYYLSEKVIEAACRAAEN
jgi:predicted nucleic acid-binding protein